MHVLITTVLFIASGLFSLHAQAKTASEIFEQVSRSVVFVFGVDDESKTIRYGSGVVLPGGDIVTNCHVLEGSTIYGIRYQSEIYPATLGKADKGRDVCTLSPIGLVAPEAKLGDSQGLKIGARVYAIGAPEGLELTMSEGIVSGLREMEEGRYIQTTAPISHGSSGGGLFDDEGRLIGLPTFYLKKGQQLNFAVPVDWIEQLLVTPDNALGPSASTDTAISEEDDSTRKADESATKDARQVEPDNALEEANKHRAIVSRVVERYRDLITAKVLGNTHLPDNFQGNPEVRCLVRVLPTGEVWNIQVTQSSGNPAYDEAVVHALQKSSPLPLPSDREARNAFVPELTFVYRPNEWAEAPSPGSAVSAEKQSQRVDEGRPVLTQSEQPNKRPIGRDRVLEEPFTPSALKVDSPRSISSTPLMFAGLDRKPIPEGLDSINSTAARLQDETPPRHHPGNQAPRYPIQAIGMRAEGRVLVRAEIRPDGTIGKRWIKQSSGLQVLDLAALETVNGWRFVPAKRHGLAVAVWIDVPIEYKLP